MRRYGSDDLGVKTELKNINSFRALHRAIEFEVKRQVEVVESGGTVVQETGGWSESEQRTFAQRSKEFAEDYRYFPEPGLPPLELHRAWIEELRRALPELPGPRRGRLGAGQRRIRAAGDRGSRHGRQPPGGRGLSGREEAGDAGPDGRCPHPRPTGEPQDGKRPTPRTPEIDICLPAPWGGRLREAKPGGGGSGR